MADSENSRTLSTISRGKKGSTSCASKKMPYVINRRNLLPVAARVLEERLAEIPRRTVSGPTRVSELWPKWWDLHQQRLNAAAVRKNLERQLRDEVGARSEVKIEVAGEAEPRIVGSLKEISALTRLIGKEQVAQARALLRQRQRQWKKVNQRIGYTEVLLAEEDIKTSEGIAGRVLLVMQPYHLVEIAAKLHCMFVMKDPELKLEQDPWPQLRIMLKEIIQPRFMAVEAPIVFGSPPAG
ncbi:hypothetical protein RHIZ_23025 [Rhizobium skierniewicense]|uniref:hypothetical protein n=1 Tax=Rhizobium skierniewicense TaxID=984260 RepID=UPI001FAE2645|nr:hypothetical protein [Rhizobium skierniewicense]MCI9868828.1 hypothetical protein [Rhizobium skierniewicense]